jgi:predicted RNA-binding protein with PIN domain
MPYIIDGNNLIGSCSGISLEDPQARPKLIHIIRRFQENRNNNIIIVFDGVPGNGVHREEVSPKLCVRYPLNGSSADEEIKQILEGFDCFKDVILVTSDRELREFAKKKGAKIINSIEFYFQLKRVSRISGMKEETEKRIDARLSDQEVDLWLKIFDR